MRTSDLNGMSVPAIWRTAQPPLKPQVIFGTLHKSTLLCSLIRESSRKGGERMSELQAFAAEEDGVAVVEIVLILLVLIALVLVFKSQITKVLKNILSKVSSQSNSV